MRKLDAGLVTFPAIAIPVSEYLSEQAADAYVERLGHSRPSKANSSIDAYRRAMDEQFYAPRLAVARSRWPVRIEHTSIGKVRVDVIDPLPCVSNQNQGRVLINLHGGGFCVGEGMGGLIESIPIAVTLGIRVISVHYRQGPENAFPAASEDVAAVYCELLEKYPPGGIGLYGCSDGGLLAAMSIAWLLKEDKPLPGAIGLISAPAGAVEGGDSRYIGAVLDPTLGGPLPQPALVSPPYPRAYLNGADINSGLVSPMEDATILSRFPPTLLIASTRSPEFSSVIQTSRLLRRAGVHAQLDLWDGLWHGFVYDVGLPEAEEAFQVIGKFFDIHLQETSA